MDVCVMAAVQYTVRVWCTVWLCMTDEQHEHWVDIIGQWISVKCYRRGFTSVCQTVDWCVCVCVRCRGLAARHLLSFVFIPDRIYTRPKVAVSWPYVTQTWWYFHMKPGKAVKKTMGRTDVECAGLNSDVFFPSRYSWPAWKLNFFSKSYLWWVKKKDCFLLCVCLQGDSWPELYRRLHLC